MCGITGILHPQRPPDHALITAMTRTLAHRGPDDEGVFVDSSAGIALGHRRLAVVDLSSDGHQPMHSENGRYVITFNGEIYNHRALRAELAAMGAVTPRRGDTAVLLCAIEAWGLEKTLLRIVGIFAFALWDTHTRELHLVRDHVGVKPLYFGEVDGAFVFASELKPFRVAPNFAAEIDRGALALYLRYNCVPAPWSIYRGVAKLMPGHVLTMRDGSARSRPYWSARAAAESGARESLQLSDDEVVDQLELKLRDAVRLQMVADVPLGAFLSGGIDSSTVVALMQTESSARIRTFSLGFDGEFDEAHHARVVANHLQTDHTELYLTADDALSLIPGLPHYFDEPFADSSQLPTMLISQLARRSVTVALSGDGGDELFAGYNRHRVAERIWRGLRPVAAPVRRAVARAIHAIPSDVVERGARTVALMRPPAAGARVSYKLQKLAAVMSADSPAAVYRTLVSHWSHPESVVLNAVEPQPETALPHAWPALNTFTEQMMYLDLVSYLPDDVLTKVDRASMAVALELRVPLLDHRVVEFAWRIPLAQKLRGTTGKWALRKVLHRHVPPALVERPKSGFAVPVAAWLRGPLRDWAETLLQSQLLRTDGFFEPEVIRAKWESHLSGRRDCSDDLWDVLMFQAWYHHAH